MAGTMNRFFGVEGDRKRESEGAEHMSNQAFTQSTGSPQTASQNARGPAPSDGAEPTEFQSTLGSGSVLEGKIVCKGPTRFGGRVSGEIEADEFVVVEDGAVIEANLQVRETIIAGHIVGDIVAEDKVTLRATAKIEGNIATPSLAIEEGAQIDGSLRVSPKSNAAVTSSHASRVEESVAASPSGDVE